ncbi:hypothetical protein [Dactylosporangium sp. CA-092794]|uniref:hypothetical protein n=1 Tax=Dactylosporangium sp. CA-092794 TaxID=3239929 RepID=UPI003D90D938
MIQFGVSMSAVRSTGPGRLVAAQYPQWNGAIDLLTLATGANLRRLKQQCELLSYGYALFEESL